MLQEKQRKKARKQDLEKERQQLEMEKQLLNARVETEQALMELSSARSDGRQIGKAMPLLPTQTYETVGRYRDCCGGGLPRLPSTPLSRPEKGSLIPENSCRSSCRKNLRVW